MELDVYTSQIIIYKRKSVICDMCKDNVQKVFILSGDNDSILCESCAKIEYGSEFINKCKQVIKPTVNREEIIKEKRKW